MKRQITTYGIIAGLIVSLMWVFTVAAKDKMDYENGMIIGFTTMILAFSLIFFAIQSFKKNNGGIISFKQSFLIGLGITAICSAMYVISWMIVYYNFMPNFMEDYSAYYIDKIRNSGKSEAEINKAIRSIEEQKDLYKNPIVVVLYTLLEIFPVGLLVTLIAALVEKFRTKKQTPQAV